MGATAFDNADGDITSMIVTGGLPIDTSIIGTQTITYDVTDTSGNAAKTKKRFVEVRHTEWGNVMYYASICFRISDPVQDAGE